MKCANCQMLNNTPETPCTHCGHMIPALKPVTFTESDDAEGESSGIFAEGQEEAQEKEAQDEAPEEVVPEKGHVDNVGDETETETVVP